MTPFFYNNSRIMIPLNSPASQSNNLGSRVIDSIISTNASICYKITC